jgi:hypothetical protein
MLSLQARTLARAAAIVGGLDILAGELAISSEMLGRYVRGESPTPPDVFMRAADIVTEAGVADAAKPSRRIEDAL